ncbi:DUF4942 domain-containing protein [Pantoea sp. B9002]|uniref:DUF4942 domain-containing protein n=1 Tax=Pantoea sp. B9002 TaxID=2726979 RepID=UPI0015A38DB1|nr:DUF4942 domain-containing protein [Pantoea sp. B9002]NWA61606.1 DUF4942 domain-containing protein [Pantoea sp. B9002]
MQIEPEVITEHTELINSTNIERIVTGRDAALGKIELVIQELSSISQLTAGIGGGNAIDWAMKSGHRYGCWLMEKPENALPKITNNIDRSIWRDLMLKSGMLSLMDAQAREQWHKSLEEGDVPAVNQNNIISTFEQLHINKGEVFERGVINLFKGLSWNYKTNSPIKFGRKIIMNNLVCYSQWGFRLNWGIRRDQLVDLERMVTLFDGKPLPDNRADISQRLDAHLHAQRESSTYEDDYFSIRCFQKGSAHITFKQEAITDRLNDVLIRHYPEALASSS